MPFVFGLLIFFHLFLESFLFFFQLLFQSSKLVSNRAESEPSRWRVAGRWFHEVYLLSHRSPMSHSPNTCRRSLQARGPSDYLRWLVRNSKRSHHEDRRVSSIVTPVSNNPKAVRERVAKVESHWGNEWRSVSQRLSFGQCRERFDPAPSRLRR